MEDSRAKRRSISTLDSFIWRFDPRCQKWLGKGAKHGKICGKIMEKSTI
jgi:hypothetical protein